MKTIFFKEDRAAPVTATPPTPATNTRAGPFIATSNLTWESLPPGSNGQPADSETFSKQDAARDWLRSRRGCGGSIFDVAADRIVEEVAAGGDHA